VAASLVEEAERLVTACASEVDKAVAAAEALVAQNKAKEESIYDATCKSEKDLGTLLDSIEKTQVQLAEKMDSIKAPIKGAMSEAKSGILKLNAKLGTLDAKCKKTYHCNSSCPSKSGERCAHSNRTCHARARPW